MKTHPDDGWNQSAALREQIRPYVSPDPDQERLDLLRLQAFAPEHRRRVREHQHAPTLPPPQAPR